MVKKPQDFSTLASINSNMSFSDWLRFRSVDQWQKMMKHRFIKDITSNTFPTNVFERYLHLEHKFVRAAITIFSYALAKAPHLSDQNHLINILYALANDQEEYFQQTFNLISPSHLDSEQIKFDGESAMLYRGAVEIAEKCTYLEILSAMLAAEWMYLTWCQEASLENTVEPMKSWILLHVAPEFSGQVDWMRNRINLLGAEATVEIQEACVNHFKNMLIWEIEFHDAPYEIVM